MTMPLPRTRDDLLRSLQQTELPDEVVAHLSAQARPAQLLTTEPAGPDAPLGASRLGGAPDLPAAVPWPERPPYPDASTRAASHRRRAKRLLEDSKQPGTWMKPGQGERFSQEHLAQAEAVENPFPLAFFGQFDLAALARIDGFDPALPGTGRLLVFYDFWQQPEEFTPEAAVGWRVVWDDSPVESLVRAPVPDALAAISNESWTCLFEPALVSATAVVTAIPLNDKGWDAFDLANDRLTRIYGRWFGKFGTPDQEGGENHQLGGYPRPLQNGLQARSQLASNGIACGDGKAWDLPEAKALLADAKAWRLLLQIGVDPNSGMDGPGAYYVIIRDDDLAARRFERARVTYQCD